MLQHRRDLPQPGRAAFLTDGGLETSLVFQEGLDLPHFAAFPLLDSAEGRRTLRRYYEPYLRLAADRGLGFVLDTPTWRANADWAPRLGYDLDGLRRVNRDAVAFVEELRAAWESPATPILLNGVVGPRGDGYVAGTMDPAEAEDYHAFQVDAFVGTAADMMSAITMNTVGEAIGIARAARARDLPCVVSFTVETDGRLVGGRSLREAVEATDEATGGWPAYYMVNCAHPTHCEDAMRHGGAWASRLGGLRANASTKSHAELDEATELDEGDAADLGKRYRDLRDALPSLTVLGGCCGTDHRHVEAIRDACLPTGVGPTA